MSQNKRESITGFVDDKLKIHINTSFVLNNDYIYHLPFDGYYQMYYLRTGNFIIYSNNKRFSVNQGSIFISDFNKELRIKSNIESNDSYTKTEIIVISIHPKLFSSLKGDENFYRIFESLNIFSNEELKGFDFENIIFKNIDKYIAFKLGLINFQGLISMLITELNFIYDANKQNDYVSNTDDYEVKIFDFISRNFMNDITLESVSSKFNVSHFYIEKVTKKFYSHSFYKTIINMRMWHARDLMKNIDIRLNDIAELCGYTDYSGFYKAYVKFFKVSPKKDFEYYKKNNDYISNYI